MNANYLFLVLATALIGGLVARAIKTPILVGIILAGVIAGSLIKLPHETVESLAEIGVMLLLFSVGLEMSLARLAKLGPVVVLGSIIQIVLVMFLSFMGLVFIGHIPPPAALVLGAGFSLSSTAIIVKMLDTRGESGTLHADMMIGWALMQDLAVIPMVVLLPTLVSGGDWAAVAGKSILTASVVLITVFLLGRLVAPYILHKIAGAGSRELLILAAVALGLGTAALVNLFGISGAFGAFLAGLVISETQEKHAVFAETRPLRDLFSLLFFVTLGFLVTPAFIIANIVIILSVAVLVMLLKFAVIFVICHLWRVRGKTQVAVSIGMAQIGEFAFVLFLLARDQNIMTADQAGIGMAATLITFIITPFLFKSIVPIWRRLKRFNKLFSSGVKKIPQGEALQNHIIICGYGRMGRWIGRALEELKLPFVVIDYNQKVVRDAKLKGTPAIYGDPSEVEVLETAFIKNAKAIVVTIPDTLAQEEIISYVQSHTPDVKIIARAHLDEDIHKLTSLKVKKVVQPEFEAAVTVIRDILVNLGRPKEEVAARIKHLRLSHAVVK